MKTHWLFGSGPDKVVKFELEIDKETDCNLCIHREVCDVRINIENRCSNYEFGRSDATGCQSCVHRFTRFDKEPIPCFHCAWFKLDPDLKVETVGSD